MDADTHAFWIRFAKSAAFVALGAAAHVWLLPSLRHAGGAELVAVADRAGVPQQSARAGASVIGMLESTPDHLAGAVPRSPLVPEPAPVGSSSRVTLAVETVAARAIYDHPPAAASRGQQIAANDTAEAIGTAGTDTTEPVSTSGSLGDEKATGSLGTVATMGGERASDAPVPASLTAELQLASDALSPLSHRSTHEVLAVAKPVATADTPHIAVNARQLMDDEQMVRRVLQQYRTAYEQLDAAAAKSVWPTVDERALTHAFQQLSSQRLTFRSCGVSITGTGANARCRGEAEYLPKIGAKRAFTTQGEWVFDLTREQTAWRIVNASVQ